MSDEDKARQIGQAVQEYQAAKIEVAHIEKKIKDAMSVYFNVGATMDSSRGTVEEPKITNDGVLHFGRQYSYTNYTEADFLSWKDLYALVRDRDIARKRRDEAKQLMNSLGIPDLA